MNKITSHFLSHSCLSKKPTSGLRPPNQSELAEFVLASFNSCAEKEKNLTSREFAHWLSTNLYYFTTVDSKKEKPEVMQKITNCFYAHVLYSLDRLDYTPGKSIDEAIVEINDIVFALDRLHTLQSTLDFKQTFLLHQTVKKYKNIQKNLCKSDCIAETNPRKNTVLKSSFPNFSDFLSQSGISLSHSHASTVDYMVKYLLTESAKSLPLLDNKKTMPIPSVLVHQAALPIKEAFAKVLDFVILHNTDDEIKIIGEIMPEKKYINILCKDDVDIVKEIVKKAFDSFMQKKGKPWLIKQYYIRKFDKSFAEQPLDKISENFDFRIIDNAGDLASAVNVLLAIAKKYNVYMKQSKDSMRLKRSNLYKMLNTTLPLLQNVAHDNQSKFAALSDETPVNLREVKACISVSDMILHILALADFDNKEAASASLPSSDCSQSENYRHNNIKFFNEMIKLQREQTAVYNQKATSGNKVNN